MSKIKNVVGKYSEYAEVGIYIYFRDRHCKKAEYCSAIVDCISNMMNSADTNKSSYIGLKRDRKKFLKKLAVHKTRAYAFDKMLETHSKIKKG